MKRPPLERTGPIRSWSAVFRPPETRASADEVHGAASFDDVVTRSVDLAYQVIDDYVRRGQEAARRTGGGEQIATLATDVPDLAARVVRYASDLAATWAEFLEVMIRAGARDVATEGRHAPADPAAPEPGRDVRVVAAAPGASVPPLRFRLHLDAASAADVALDLITMPTTFPVTVHALRTPSGDPPRLEGASMTTDGDGVATLHLHVPAGQPPGTYEGLLVDDHGNRPLGRLTVSIRDRR